MIFSCVGSFFVYTIKIPDLSLPPCICGVIPRYIGSRERKHNMYCMNVCMSEYVFMDEFLFSFCNNISILHTYMYNGDYHCTHVCREGYILLPFNE
jgi:hypothetical protein